MHFTTFFSVNTESGWKYWGANADLQVMLVPASDGSPSDQERDQAFLVTEAILRPERADVHAFRA